MLKRRLSILLLCCSAILILLAGRLIEIQLLETETFSKHRINLLEESVRQRSQEIEVDNGRGDFLDRNGEQLTDKKIIVLVLFPFLKKMNWKLNMISKILNVPSEKVKAAVFHSTKPFVYGGERTPIELTTEQLKQINALKIPGVFAVEKNLKRPVVPAEHLIGLVGENSREVNRRYPDQKLSEKTIIGVSGLQQSFDEFLLSEGRSKLIYHVDGEGTPLFGQRVLYSGPANPFYPLNIRTTIDKKIQEKAEKLTDSHRIRKGGLVLLNLKDNSILAMVSRPTMDNKNPYKSNGITNLMVKQQVIGSVFKTVTAAAAIDHNLVSPLRLFDCNKKIDGSEDLTYHYGRLNFQESFSRSCNYTFGSLAQELKRLDPGTLEKYANKLSLLGPVGWEGDIYHLHHFQQMKDEEQGRLYLTAVDKEDDLFAAQTGIGQHEVRATPLAVANMMATIARGGKKEMVRSVLKIEYQNGTTMLDFPQKEMPGERIPPYTAMKLQQLLREVVTNPRGTGRAFQPLPYEVAGKSGTAETGKYQNGIQLHNKWFAGYFPFHHPKYALVVVDLDIPSDKAEVNQLFSDMVKGLYEMEQTKIK